MITKSHFIDIANKYGKFASWAVWAEEGIKPKSNIGDLSIFDLDKYPKILDCLDKNISDKHLSGLTDLVITDEEFSGLQIPCEKVFIFENKTNFSNLMNFLTFPQMENTIGIFGSGFSVSKLKNALCLADKEIFYWGDIDTHGFKILSQIRGYFSNTKSIMMDFETLNTFKDDWDKGEPIHESSLPNLNSDEQELFQYVRADNINTIRLEQEKINHKYVLKALNKIYEAI